MSSSKAKMDAYNRSVEQAELVQVALTDSRARIGQDAHDPELKSEKFLAQDVVNGPTFDKDTSLLMGQVRCRMWMSPEGTAVSDSPEERDQAFEAAILGCEVTYVVVYAIEGQHDDATLTNFFNNTAPFSTWAYFRVHVASVAGEACVDIPVLPIKRLFHKVESAGGYREGGDALPSQKASG